MVDSVSQRAWWSDDAIESSVGDALGRGPFAGRLAGLLDEIAARPSSTVVGLVGPWGSGKSSTVNLVREQLTDRWTIVDINPWALPGPEYLIAEILGAITNAEPMKGKDTDRLRTALIRYAKYAVPVLAAVPVVGSALATSGAAVLNDVVAGDTQPKQAAELNRLLTELKPRLLMVIDDVDRLQPNELLALFRAIRVLGRLNHVHYLLSYDEKTMLDVLTRTELARGDRARALDFLEKIVTVRLDQPPTRDEQAAELFDRQMELLQSSLEFPLSEEQQSRLNLEREALLGQQLTEPRGIRRFFAQLHAYLPLIGAEEIDIVDFMVLSVFRVSYPSLYEAVRIERRELVDAEWAAREDPDTVEHRWVRELDQVADHPATRQRLRWALERLFPLIDPDGSHDLDRLRVGKRVADPDHVDRYFALTPPGDDVSTSELVAGLAELVSERPTDRSMFLAGLLRPASSDRRAWDRSARLFRRAAALAGNLRPAEARRLLRFGVSLAPVTAPQGLPTAAVQAAQVWLTALIRVGGALTEAELLNVIGGDPHRPSALASYLAALKAVLSQSTHPDQFAGAIRDSAELAWQRFIDNVRLSDDAPHERTAELLRWAQEHLTLAELQERTSREIEQGLSVADLAARLVVIGRSSNGYDTMLDFDAALARALLGGGPGLTAVASLRATESAAQHDSEPDEDDVSWPSLRRVGVAQLLEDALPPAEVGQTAITSDPGMQLASFRPSLVTQQLPGLYLSVNVMVPSGVNVSIEPETDPALVEPREALLLKLARRSPLARWAAAQADRWGAELTDWAISPYSRNYSVTTATLHTGPNGELPVGAELGMQLQAERQRSPGAARPVLLAASVGIYPEQAARLELPELYKLLMALMLQVSTGWSAWNALVNDHPKPTEVGLSLLLEATAPVSQLIDIGTADQQGTGAAQLQEQWNVAVRPPNYVLDLEPLKQALNGSLNGWLIDCKYRNVEAVIEAAAQAYQPD